nr:Rpn family recombination-promoting nuclease/putative transposase [Cardinium endosymbiont of Dermatophagoides farinae]
MLDLNTLKIEKKYVEDNLKQKFSDLVFSIKMKNNDKAFIYTLIEAEVSPKYWTAFKLWKYMFLLLERHKTKKKSKLPLIIPLVVYHGNTPFTVQEIYGNCLVNLALLKSLWEVIID